VSRLNFWWETAIACARGEDWRPAVADAERAAQEKPARVLTRRGLRDRGITYTRQHLHERVQKGAFPKPFHMPAA
jgi:hypothetical protein